MIRRRTERPIAGRSNRKRARRQTIDTLISWKALLLLAAFIAAWALLIGASRMYAQAWGVPLSDFVWGVLVGVALASVPWMMWVVVTAVDGSASWREGAQSEEMTSTALRKLGPEWQVEHDLPFAAGLGDFEVDIDHVAVGPYGVLVVETKSTTKEVDLNWVRLPPRVQDAARQVEKNAGRVRAVLQAFPNVPVIPVVIYWGQFVRPAPKDHVRRVGDVRLVRGSDVKHWVPLLAGRERVDKTTQEAVMAKLRKAADRQRATQAR